MRRMVLSAAFFCFLDNAFNTYTFSRVSTGGRLVRFAQSGLSDGATHGQRVALVTGANKGIGKEIARKLAAMPGMTIILGCRSTQLGTAAAQELLGDSESNIIVQGLDLTDSDSISAVSSFIQQEFGQLDILVNNAAVCFNDPTLYGKVPHTPFQQQAGITVDTNYFGTLAVTQGMLPLLHSASSPRVVNIASAAGRLRGSKQRVDAFTSASLTIPQLTSLMNEFVSDAEEGMHAKRGWPNTCYGVSKMGLIALTRVLARTEPRIMVNSVDPGFCATDQNQYQGYISAEQGARTPAWLIALPPEPHVSGKHFFEEQEISWSYA